MATPTLIPVSEYLLTFYDPDRDYLEGELEERNMGEQQHGFLQGVLTAIFFSNRRAWGIRPVPEQRIRIAERRYRIADLCILRNTDPPVPVVDFAPLICIEVISSGQSFAEHQARVTDYAALGVENIWVIDPAERRALLGTAGGYQPLPDDILGVAGTPIRIPLTDLWAELDDLAAGRV